MSKASEMAAPIEIEGTGTCSRCKAIVPRGASRCAECGAPAERALDGGGLSIAARREASQALKRGYRWVGAITWLYRFGAAGYAMLTVVAVVALAKSSVPRGPGILIAVLFTAMTVTMLMGAIQILFRPFFWTLTIACLATLVAIVHVIGPNPLELAHFWSGAWALAFWMAVAPAFQLRRMIDRYTDLYVEHHASRATRRSLIGNSPEERHQRLLRALHRASRKAWRTSLLTGGVIAAASGVGASLVLTNLRPDEYADSQRRFESAWNAGDAQTVAALFVSGAGEPRLRWLEGAFEGHRFRSALPQLPAPSLAVAESATIATYDLGGRDLTVRWQLDGQHWVLAAIDFPLPPIEPVFERFLEAWRASDAQALSGFFSEENQARMLENILAAVAKREWESYPEVHDVRGLRADIERDATVDLYFERGRGLLETRWFLRPDGRWGLRGLKWPAR